jgi:hypothetical protein
MQIYTLSMGTSNIFHQFVYEDGDKFLFLPPYALQLAPCGEKGEGG